MSFAFDTKSAEPASVATNTSASQTNSSAQAAPRNLSPPLQSTSTGVNTGLNNIVALADPEKKKEGAPSPTRAREDKPTAPQAPAEGKKRAPDGPGGTQVTEAVASPASGSAGVVLMPKPPKVLGPESADALRKARRAAKATATATSTLPSGDVTVKDARGAVTEPVIETRARGEQKAAEELDERPPASETIDELCAGLDGIMGETPTNEKELSEKKPREDAKQAGQLLNGQVESKSETVTENYTVPDNPPLGPPPAPAVPYVQPPTNIEAPAINAAGASPTPIPDANLSLDADIAAQRSNISAAGMDTEPALLVQTGPIAAAREAESELSQTGPQDSSRLVQEQLALVQSARSDLAGLEANAVQQLQNGRGSSIAERVSGQAEMVLSEEQMRVSAGEQMHAIYSVAKSRVNELLGPLPAAALAKWEKGTDVASSTFEAQLKVVLDWLAERYESFWGGAHELWDSLTGLPKWVTDKYDDAEAGFVGELKSLLIDISRDVNAVIAACQAIIAQARADIDVVVQGLPEELKAWAAAEAATVNGQLDQLESDANSVRDNIEKDLSSRATTAVQEVHDRVDALREKAKGLIGKITSAIAEIAGDVGRFIINGLLELLGISPAAFWDTVAKIQSVVAQIADDPVGFATNLLGTLKAGFQLFFDNIGGHLADGLMEWLFSELGSVGVTMPKDTSLKSIITLFLQLMGITWERIRGLIAKHIGEENLALIEKAVELVSVLIESGPSGIYEMIKEKLDPSALIDMVIDAAIDFMIEALVKQVTVRIIALFNPVGAILVAVEAIYRVLSWVFKNGAKIFKLVETIVGSIADIAAGNIGGVAKMIESALASIIAPVIGFLAGYIGLGSLPKKIADVIGTMQDWVLKQMDRAIGWLVEKAKSLYSTVKTAAGEVLQWWKKKAPFSAGGERHTLYFPSKDGKLTVASTPTTLEAWLANDEKGGRVESENPALHAKIVKSVEFIQDNKEQAGEDNKKGTGKDKTMSIAAGETISKEMEILAGLLAESGLGAVLPPTVIKVEEETILGSTAGTYMHAKPLTMRKPTNGWTGSVPRDEPAWWTSVNEHRPMTYVRGHLLNHHIHGPGRKENLAPITRSFNTRMEGAIEGEAKDHVLAKAEVVEYEVKVSYSAKKQESEHPNAAPGELVLPTTWAMNLYAMEQKENAKSEDAASWIRSDRIATWSETDLAVLDQEPSGGKTPTLTSFGLFNPPPATSVHSDLDTLQLLPGIGKAKAPELREILSTLANERKTENDPWKALESAVAERIGPGTAANVMTWRDTGVSSNTKGGATVEVTLHSNTTWST